MLKQAEWVKLVYSETPTKANVKQGYLFDEGDFYRVVGTNTETLVRKSSVIAITIRKSQSSDSHSYSSHNRKRVMNR